MLRVHNALLALRKIVKRYEYKSKESRGPLLEIVNEAFPLLLPLGQRLSSDHALEAAMMLKQVLKIFWSCTQFYLPSNLTLEQISPWFNILAKADKSPKCTASTTSASANTEMLTCGRSSPSCSTTCR